jgi:hypothetical protein
MDYKSKSSSFQHEEDLNGSFHYIDSKKPTFTMKQEF